MSFRRLRRVYAQSRAATGWSRWCAAIAILAGLLTTSTAMGQDDEPPALADNVLTSENPSSFSGEIEKYLEYHLQRLFGDDPKAVKQSREQLSAPLRPEAGATFKNLYADYLITRVQRRLGSAATFNQLNAAIVAERVSRSSQSSRIAPLARQFIEDDDAAVALWGAKSVYPVFPDLVRNLPARERDGLIGALVAAAKRFPQNGPLTEEIFRTLSMRTTELRPPAAEVLVAGAPIVTPAVQDLITFRVSLYRPNQAAPSPLAEGPGLVFLTNNFVWPSQSPQQKMISITAMRNLMLQAAATANGLPTNSDERVQVVELLKRLGSAFEGISGPAQPGGPPAHPDVYRTARTLRNSTPRPSPTVLNQYISDVRGAVESAFPGLPAPELSRLGATQPAQDPTTRPTTGTAPANRQN